VGYRYDVRSAAALKISGGDNFSNSDVIVDPKTEFYTTKFPFEAKPRNRKEAQASNYWPQYLDAEHEEMVNHQENGTGSLVSRHSVPKGAQFLRTKWVYDGKKGQDKKIVRFKARLTAMGNFQRGGVDYFETYASMMRTKTLRVLLQLLNSSPDHEMEHWDKKAGFTQRLKDEGVFVARTASGGWCVIVTHVDDLFPSYNKEGRGLRDSVFKALEERVKVKNEGPVKWVLKILIERDREAGVMKISQGQFVRKVLQSFGFDGGYSDVTPTYDQGTNSVMSEEDTLKYSEEIVKLHAQQPYHDAIGCLWNLANISQPDTYFDVFQAPQCVTKPSKKLWKWFSKFFWYLSAHPDRGLIYCRPEFVGNGGFVPCDVPFLQGDAVASFAVSLGERLPMGQRYWFLGGVMDWKSKRSTQVLDSSTAECVSLVVVGKENAWLRDVLKELEIFAVNKPTVVMNNTVVIALSGQGTTFVVFRDTIIGGERPCNPCLSRM
jgi:hypothetical protein